MVNKDELDLRGLMGGCSFTSISSVCSMLQRESQAMHEDILQASYR